MKMRDGALSNFRCGTSAAFANVYNYVCSYLCPQFFIAMFDMVPCCIPVLSVRSVLFVDLLLFRFGVLGGMCDVNSRNVFLLLFMALWVPNSATLFRRAVPMLWHAFLFLGLRVFSSFLLFAWWPLLLFPC
jgi:hypothetical protein